MATLTDLAVRIAETTVTAHPVQLSGSLDLNTLTTTGIHQLAAFPTDWAAQNYPARMRGTLEVTAVTNNYVIQRFTDLDNPTTQHSRSLSTQTGNWTLWRQVSWTKADNTSTTLNLNTMVTPGAWPLLGNPADPAGQHYPIARAGLLEVFKVAAAYTLQRYTTLDPGAPVWTRRGHATNGWDAWRPDSWLSADNTSALNDLNDWHTPGVWPLLALPTDWEGQNYPVSRQGVLEVFKVHANYTLQRFTSLEDGAPKVYVRRWHTAQGWQPWSQLDDGTGQTDGKPDYFATIDRNWDNSRGLLNGGTHQLRVARRKIARALAGLEDCHLLALGDSKTLAGPAAVTEGVLDSYLGQFGELVGARVGMIYACITQDPRWTFNGFTFTPDGANRYAVGTGWVQVLTRAGHTGATVYARSATAQTVTVTIDGTDHPWDMTGTGGWEQFTQGGLADTTHTVRLTSTSEVAVLGVRCLYDTPGLQISNASRSASNSADWRQSTLWSSQWATSVGLAGGTADVLLVQMGTNDRSDPTPLPLFLGEVAATDIPTLVISPGGLARDTAADTVRTAIGTAADTHGWALLDFTHAIGDFDTATAHGLMADTVHENTAGNSIEADALTRVLTP